MSRAVVLDEVRQMAPIGVREIAENLGLSERTVRRELRRLEADGYVVPEQYQRRERVYLPTDEAGCSREETR